MNLRTRFIVVVLISIALLSEWYVTSIVPVIREDTVVVRSLFGFVFPIMALAAAACILLFRQYQNPHQLCEGVVIRHKLVKHRSINIVRDLLNQESQATTYALKIKDDRGRTGWLHFESWWIFDTYRIGSYYMTPGRLSAAQEEQRRRQYGA